MNMKFDNAPIGAKVWVDIGLGIRHVGRKYDPERIIEFSRKRGGWNIVDKKTFANGKAVHTSAKGKLPNQFQMHENMRKFSQRKYSVLSFNCDAGAQALAGLPPRSNQVDAGIVGAGTLGFAARSSGCGFWGTLAFMTIGGILGVNIAHALEQHETST